MAKPKLLCVAPEYVDEIWPHVADLIEKALIRRRSDESLEYTKRRIDDGKALLWIVWGKKQLMAVGITNVVFLEDGRKVCVLQGGGRGLKNWDYCLDDIEAYAEKEGCAAVRCYGRIGWARYLKDRGYSQPWIVVEKVLSDGRK